jgi:hypothetical protein
VNTDGRGHAAWCEDLEIIDHRGLFHIEFCSLTLNLKRIVWNLHDPK